MDRTKLEKKALAELREIASTLELSGYSKLRKADLVDLIVGETDDELSDNGQPSGAGNGGGAEENEDQDEDAATEDTTTDTTAETSQSTDTDTDRDEAAETVRTRQRSGSTRSRTRQRSTRSRGNGRASKRETKKKKKRKSGSGSSKRSGESDSSRGGRSDDDRDVREGVLDLLPEGYGFLRCTGYLTGDEDVYVSQSYVRRFRLRRGDLIRGPVRHNKGDDKFPALDRIDAVEGLSFDEHMDTRRRKFKDLTPLFPHERFHLETDADSPIAMRIVDMMTPIGKGQRGLIVSPPKAGKTTILKQIAHAIETNHPDTHVMVVLVDERPEEVTDFERSTSGEVIASTFDRPADDHTQVAELTIERAKRLVERGRNVVILLDSITRLGRAYNLAAPASGRILSGGIDSAALYPPKRFFGAARNIEEGGSLTIIATALVETGSKMDEVIFEEFKGTGNMELRLDRKMEQKRIFPAVDVQASGTRKEELLLNQRELQTAWKLRRALSQMESSSALELLIDKLKATKSNEQFLQMISQSNIG